MRLITAWHEFIIPIIIIIIIIILSRDAVTDHFNGFYSCYTQMAYVDNNLGMTISVFLRIHLLTTTSPFLRLQYGLNVGFACVLVKDETCTI